MSNNKKLGVIKISLMTISNMEKLYDYLFHYNPYEKVWYAFKREEHGDYFNGKKKGMLRNSDLNEILTDILIKNNIKLDETEV